MVAVATILNAILLKENTVVTKIDRNELIKLISTKRDLVLLEALPAKYYNAEHLPGALHMPHDEVQTLAPKLVPNKNTPVAVYCANKNCQNSWLYIHVIPGFFITSRRYYPDT